MSWGAGIAGRFRPGDTVRVSAAIALRSVDPKRFREMGPQLVPSILEATRRIDHDQMRRALQALSDLGPVAVDALPDLRAWQQRCEKQDEAGDRGLGDYAGRRVSSIEQEKLRNPRLGAGKTMEEFKQIMSSLKLPYPKFIDYAVPGNRQCGVCPSHLPEQMQEYCRQMAFSPQG